MCPEFDKRYTSKRWATFNYNSSKTSGLGMTGAKSKEKRKISFYLSCFVVKFVHRKVYIFPTGRTLRIVF